jgi:hypothetical protein
MQGMLMSLLLKHNPEELTLTLAAKHAATFTHYHSIPHLCHPIIKSSEELREILKQLITEINWRLDLFQKHNVNSLAEFNAFAKEKESERKEEKQSQNVDSQSNRESQTPVIDVLTQKGYDIIPSPIIKSTKIDCIAVSKDTLYVCLVDKEVGDWLADEEKFNDEEPLWFSESSHRISPVRLVEVVCDALRTKLSVSDMKFKVVPHVVIQSGNVINAEDMFEIWDEMNINVTRINRGSPKEIRLFSKVIDICDAKADDSTLEKLRKLFRSMA